VCQQNVLGDFLNVFLTLYRNISVIIRPTSQFIRINSLHMFRALICSSSGGTVYSATGTFCAEISIIIYNYLCTVSLNVKNIFY
jgi:hypothetical protein